ncbi:MarR family transcriptional regulator [Aerococcus agrisoli]|uniref:MarR family transcriptional regulator n=1 Tax=Aerococcus agrisoli TaxID=2487350 RepID=A0A3N4G6M8_9LACT|nr:MarR family transcriptional regulator [Aerococcus agrisoli]RPA58432.1 MarR family transcriptional regulator [Aerococcus agrisoli]
MHTEDQPMEVGRLLRELMISIHRYVGEQLSEHDLGDMKGPQSMALGYIIKASKEDEVFGKDLEKMMNIRKSSSSELIGRLIKNGYVTTEKSEKDGRYKRLIVTEEGYAAFQKVHELFVQVEDALTAGLSEEEVAQLKATLHHLHKNVQF